MYTKGIKLQRQKLRSRRGEDYAQRAHIGLSDLGFILSHISSFSPPSSFFFSLSLLSHSFLSCAVLRRRIVVIAVPLTTITAGNGSACNDNVFMSILLSFYSFLSNSDLNLARRKNRALKTAVTPPVKDVDSATSTAPSKCAVLSMARAKKVIAATTTYIIYSLSAAFSLSPVSSQGKVQ